jgi:prepilin-type processing-associated H-X9-DG protein
MEYSDYPKPPFKRVTGTPAWATCACSLGCIFIALVILFPIFAQTHESAKNPSCLSHIRQLDIGILMYSQDYDEALPRKAHWMDDVYPYIKNREIYHCPQVAQRDRLLFGYAFQMQLSGKNLKNISAPSTTVILYDSSNTEWNASDALSSLPDPPRHSGGNNFGYVDGHAKWARLQANSRMNGQP